MTVSPTARRRRQPRPRQAVGRRSVRLGNSTNCARPLHSGPHPTTFLVVRTSVNRHQRGVALWCLLHNAGVC